MQRRVLIIAFDYYKSNIPLQPWRYIHELALTHKRKGDEVIIISNGNAVDFGFIDDITVKYLVRISPFDPDLRHEILTISPDLLYWWASPRTFTYYKLFQELKIPVNLLYTGAIYTFREVIRAWQHLAFSEVKAYLIDVLTPGFLLQKLINSSVVDNVITLSERNKSRFIKMGCKEHKIQVVPIGKETNHVYTKMPDRDTKTLLYITSATRIRGVEMLLKAFGKLAKENSDVSLKILARPSNQYKKDRITFLCCKYEIESRVTLVEEWLEKDQILHELATCRALVMPFVLVPSEMPISIIESFSVATPVIAPDIDGIPEMIGNKGIIYKHASAKGLLNALKRMISADRDIYLEWTTNCRTGYSTMQSYSEQFLTLVK